MSRARFAQKSIERRQRERQKLDVQRLQMGQTGQRVRVESGDDPRGNARDPAAGPAGSDDDVAHPVSVKPASTIKL